jgi:protein-tyrosine-phosphatase
MDRSYSILFIWRRNSARDPRAEAVVTRHNNGCFHTSSAAVEPAAEVDATTLQVVQHGGYPTGGLRPKQKHLDATKQKHLDAIGIAQADSLNAQTS